MACFDDDPDTATSPIFVFAASAVVGARNYRGAFQASAMASTNKLTLDGAGRLVLTDTSEGGAITVRGFFPPVTGGAGLHTAAEFVAHGGTITDTNRYGEDQDVANVTGAVATVTAMANDAITAAALNADAVDAILDDVIEGSLTMRQALRIILAALAGKSNGGGTATIKFRNLADDGDSITATVDAGGNRTAITYRARKSQEHDMNQDIIADMTVSASAQRQATISAGKGLQDALCVRGARSARPAQVGGRV